MQDGFVATSHGRIHFIEAGEGAPLILLHSNGGSGHQFLEVMKILSRERRVIAWDMPGHGDSDPISRHHSVPDYADAVVSMMDRLGIERADIAGSSIGGSVSVALGARHGGRVRRLIPVETPVRTQEDWAGSWTATEMAFGTVSQTEAQVQPRVRNLTAAMLTRWNIDRAKAGVKTMIDVMWAIRQYDAVADMPRITPPTLVIFGGNGSLLGKADMMRELIPRCAVAIADGCGHFPMMDDPEGFAAMVSAFLNDPGIGGP